MIVYLLLSFPFPGIKSLVPCPICGKEISYKNNLDRHMRIHSETKSYKCVFCEKSFRASDNLAKHVNSQHTKQNTYVCDLCARVFYCAVNLIAHKKTHENNRLFQCNECQRFYKSKMALKAHLFRHTGIRRYICGICSGRFVTNSELRSHDRIVHQRRELKYECLHCGLKYYSKAILEAHVRKHTDERPFMCEFCPKTFRRKETLVKHRYRHTGERPHKCPKCPKAYTDIYIMKRHVRHMHPEVEI